MFEPGEFRTENTTEQLNHAQPNKTETDGKFVLNSDRVNIPEQ